MSKGVIYTVMKRMFILFLPIFLLTNTFFASIALADGLPVSFGMNKEQVKAVMGKPYGESKGQYSSEILTYRSIPFGKYDNTMLNCAFFSDALLEATYYFMDLNKVSNDVKYLKTRLESMYGKECKDETEIKNCLAVMEVLGPYSHIGYSDPFVWKKNNIYIVLQSEDTLGGIRLVYLVDFNAFQ